MENALEAIRPSLILLLEDDSGHRFLVYATEKKAQIDLRYEGQTFWASQPQMAEMFGVSQQAVTRHVRNIFEEGELVGGIELTGKSC